MLASKPSDGGIMVGRRRIRRLQCLLALLVLLGGLGLVGASPAAATAQNLCTGYSGCNAVGDSDAGYGAHSGTSYWGMYAGHNCTNYAAYRLVQNHIDASYLQGQGMAWQ